MNSAKDLFFRYDGSTFCMSRDGADRQYAMYNVPRSTEKLWLKELTEQKLAALDENGNCWVIHFLLSHGDFKRLPKLLATSPRGKLCEKTVFLEQLLRYLSECRKRGLFGVRIEEGYARVVSLAEALMLRARSINSKARIQAVIDSANSIRGH